MRFNVSEIPLNFGEVLCVCKIAAALTSDCRSWGIIKMIQGVYLDRTSSQIFK